MIDRRTLCITAGAVLTCGTTTRAAMTLHPSFKTGLGPFGAKSAAALSFRVDAQDKDLNVRVTYPDAPGPHPVIVFSHGALSSKDLYNRVADHWASHGYATILPTHLDSESLGYSFKNPLPRDKVFFGRIGDMAFILDNLEAIAARAGIAGKLDAQRIAAAGHSFGGWMALIMAGLPVKMPDGSSKSFRDKRVKAMMAYNGIGPMDQIDNDRWGDVKIPVLAASGTNDPGATGDGMLRPWRWRMGAYDLAGSKEKYAVSITMGDHYYGGLICREGAGGQPDAEGLSFVNGASSAFLDAYLKADNDAKKFLRTVDLRPLTNDRAFLERS
ncbi:MAG: dienelactone hydrolase family protein [Rhodospirillaceae bacterium]|nr:dienelactone hydrolase family protein [Rhodospirillaceae bacterium]